MFEEEKAVLPATQKFVEMERRRLELNTEIDTTTRFLEEKQQQYRQIASQNDYSLNLISYETKFSPVYNFYLLKIIVEEAEMKQLANEIVEIKDRRKHLRAQSSQTDFRNEHLGIENETRVFIRKCPQISCRGYLSSQWQCGVCEIHICQYCQEIKTGSADRHACNPDILKSVKLLTIETKPCPGCQTLIYKIDGCDMMWCVYCHVPFNWKTLKLHKGEIHNPEYFKWVRETGESAPRRGFPDRQHQDYREFFDILLKRPKNMTKEDFAVLKDVYEEVMARFFTHRAIKTDYHLMTRVEYLMNKITEEQFRQRLQRREKKDKYLIALNDLENVARSVFTALFQDFSKDPNSHAQILDEIKIVVRDLNEQLQTTTKLYNYVSITMFKKQLPWETK